MAGPALSITEAHVLLEAGREVALNVDGEIVVGKPLKVVDLPSLVIEVSENDVPTYEREVPIGKISAVLQGGDGEQDLGS